MSYQAEILLMLHHLNNYYFTFFKMNVLTCNSCQFYGQCFDSCNSFHYHKNNYINLSINIIISISISRCHINNINIIYI